MVMVVAKLSSVQSTNGLTQLLKADLLFLVSKTRLDDQTINSQTYIRASRRLGDASIRSGHPLKKSLRDATVQGIC